MMPKKRLLDEFRASGDERTALRQLSAAYLLTSAAYLLTSDFDDLLRKHGLELGEMKQAVGRLMKDFDRVGPLIAPMVKGKCRDAYWADIDSLQRLVARWVGDDVQDIPEHLVEAEAKTKQYLNDEPR